MTDNEIIKALEHCFEKCDSLCPLHSYKDCKYKLLTSALDLINRQKEEIKRLKINREALGATARVAGKATRADAITAFAKRLKQGLPTWLHDYVDMIEREMKGDE